MIDHINPTHYQKVLFIPADKLGDHLDADNNLNLQYIDIMKYTMSEEEYQGHLKGQIWKYLLRLGKKDKSSQEAQKSSWYLDKLISFFKEKE